MADAPIAHCNVFLADLILVEELTRSASALISSTRASVDSTYRHWTSLCQDLHVDPLLQDGDEVNLITILQVYAHRVQTGSALHSGNAMQTGAVSSLLCEVGQAMALLGASDPWLDAHRCIELCLMWQLKSYRRDDPPSTQVQPIPVDLLRQASANTANSPTAIPMIQACSDMSVIMFYFLMHPVNMLSPLQTCTPFAFAMLSSFVGTNALINARLVSGATLAKWSRGGACR